MTVSVILCDLGGVLIDLHWEQRARSLFTQEQSAEKLKQRWLQLQSARQYEAGKTDFAGFYQAFIDEVGGQLSFSDFKREFTGIIGPVKPDCLKILNSLRQYGTLAMLSNTNAVHVEMLRNSSGIFAPFQHLFFSYEMGMVKPDREIYETVCKHLQADPARIYFFDDSSANVEAASELGIISHLVTSPQQIYEIVCTSLPCGRDCKVSHSGV